MGLDALDSQVSGPNRAGRPMMPLPPHSWADRDAVVPGGIAERDPGRRRGVDPDRPHRALDQIEAP